MGDLAELGLHAGGDDDGAGVARDDGRSRQHDIGAVQRVLAEARGRLAHHRNRLAGDRGVVDPHRERLDHAAIGGDQVAGFQCDHVAGDQVGGGPLLENPVAHHPDLVRQQLLQGRERVLGTIDLDEREEAVDHDHPDDRPAERAHPLAGFAPVGQERQGSGHPENDREEMGELPEELQPERLATQPLDPVGAEVVQPMLGLRRRQPFGPAVQTAQGVFDRNIVNSHLGKNIRCDSQAET